MKSATTPVSSSTDEAMLHSALGLIEIIMKKMAEEASQSQQLLSLANVKTPFAAQVEKTIADPAQTLFDLSDNINAKIKAVLGESVKRYISLKSGIVESAYEYLTKDDVIFCYVELKKDEPEIRDDFQNTFYDSYEHTTISERFPIHFQFVDKDVIGGLIGVRKIAF